MLVAYSALRQVWFPMDEIVEAKRGTGNQVFQLSARSNGTARGRNWESRERLLTT